MARPKKEDIMKPIFTVDDSTVTSLKDIAEKEQEVKKEIAERTSRLKTLRSDRKRMQADMQRALRAITPTRIRRTAEQIAAANSNSQGSKN